MDENTRTRFIEQLDETRKGLGLCIYTQMDPLPPYRRFLLRVI